ncbi:MAG: ATP-binding cassette domain-containing protein [Acidimicrobiales bacterium]|nr:MAG: ATP-binding cassette domain-containing protein [Acidimicrobiales bacterium]
MTHLVDHVLALHSASRWFETAAGTVRAVDDVSLQIDVGEIVGLAGPSGSGKTTLLNLVAGWEAPDSGTVDRSAELIRGWSSLAVVPQELGLIPELTAVQNIQLAGRLSGGTSWSVEELFELLDLVGLAHRMPDELSVGEQQRVAVARAVLCGPRLLVADEPTAHQDERHADQVMVVLARAAAAGGAVLVATHDDRLLAGVDRVLHLLDGCLVPIGADG